MLAFIIWWRIPSLLEDCIDWSIAIDYVNYMYVNFVSCKHGNTKTQYNH
jgi:hypothetical protein